MAEVTADGFTEELAARGKDVAMEAARRWHSAASERLQRMGDELDYEVFPVVHGMLPPSWDATQNAAVFGVSHPAARYFEHGTSAHEIRGSPLLAFDWPEMKGEEFGDTGRTFEEVFASTWPTVILPKVEVEGIERIGYMAHGRREAARWLQNVE